MSVEQHPGESITKGTLAVLAAVLVLAVLAAGCAGDERAAQGRPGDGTTDEPSTVERTDGATAAARGGGTTEEAAGIGEGTESTGGEKPGGGQQRAARQRDGEVTLEIEGDPGTAFYGMCSSGDQFRELDGEVPASFVYALDGRKLECEIRNEGNGVLKVILASGNDRIVQQTDSQGAVITLAYSEDGVSSSTSSGSASQRSSSSISSSSVNRQSSQSSSGSR